MTTADLLDLIAYRVREALALAADPHHHFSGELVHGLTDTLGLLAEHAAEQDAYHDRLYQDCERLAAFEPPF